MVRVAFNVIVVCPLHAEDEAALAEIVGGVEADTIIAAVADAVAVQLLASFTSTE